MSDNGLKLALTIALDNLTHVEKAMREARFALNEEETSASFNVQHDRMCPSLLPAAYAHPCACGLERTIDSLRDAEAELEAIKKQLERLAK